MLLAAKRPDDARRTLLEGLGYHEADPVYLRPTLTFLLQRQEDSLLVALGRRHLPAMAPGSEPARLFALGAATASFFRGNYDQAEDLLGAVPKLAESRDGRLLAAKIEWDRGNRELALMQFRQLAAELPGDQEVHRELAGHLRQHGLMDEARRRSLSFQIAFPALAGRGSRCFTRIGKPMTTRGWRARPRRC
jgi:tetratricopeptide (TPR) repeat protein